MIDLIKLSSELISFKSVSPKSAGSLEFIKKLLTKYKFQCQILEFGQNKVKNLYAEINGGNGPNLCFAGHTDVVPPGNINEWNSDPFKSTIKGGVLYGRGASDMKSAIAAFIFSSIKFLEENNYLFNGKLSFLLTADEEGDADLSLIHI